MNRLWYGFSTWVSQRCLRCLEEWKLDTKDSRGGSTSQEQLEELGLMMTAGKAEVDASRERSHHSWWGWWGNDAVIDCLCLMPLTDTLLADLQSTSAGLKHRYTPPAAAHSDLDSTMATDDGQVSITWLDFEHLLHHNVIELCTDRLCHCRTSMLCHMQLVLCILDTACHNYQIVLCRRHARETCTRNLHKKLAQKIWRKFITVSCTKTTPWPITLHGSCHVSSVKQFVVACSCQATSGVVLSYCSASLYYHDSWSSTQDGPTERPPRGVIDRPLPNQSLHQSRWHYLLSHWWTLCVRPRN